MKILIIADEVWNDDIHGNNVLSNWFTGFDAEFAEIYCSPGPPKNRTCTRYFQVTDSMMVRSFLGKRAGKSFDTTTKDMYANEVSENVEQIPVRFYSFMKSISGNGIRLLRDLLWLLGRYDKSKLNKFIDEFNPDIVFCPRLLTPKLMRLEKIVSKMTDASFVAFTADDEASFKQVSYSPIYWTKRFFFNQQFAKHIKLYKHYFFFSQDQANEYNKKYNISTSLLFKSGNFKNSKIEKGTNNPIKLVYAGRLYCNRWKTLVRIGQELDKINSDSVRMTLDIYTQEVVSSKQKKAFEACKHIRVNKAVTPDELVQIYNDADIALHVESFDKKYKYATRVSFSTKIIDLMSSSCAIMAICWKKHAGYQYLKANDAAFCISDYEQINHQLSKISDNPELMNEYAEKGRQCGIKNHTKEIIQNIIESKFIEVIAAK